MVKLRLMNTNMKDMIEDGFTNKEIEWYLGYVLSLRHDKKYSLCFSPPSKRILDYFASEYEKNIQVLED